MKRMNLSTPRLTPSTTIVNDFIATLTEKVKSKELAESTFIVDTTPIQFLKQRLLATSGKTKEHFLQEIQARYVQKIATAKEKKNRCAAALRQRIAALKSLNEHMKSQVNNIQNMAAMEDQLFTVYETKAQLFSQNKTYQWEINAVTAIHKSYEHSSALITADRKNRKEVVVKRMISDLSWQKYVQYVMLSANLSRDAMRVNCSTQNPQLFHLSTTTLLPMLKHKGHVTEKYRVSQCLEIAKKTSKRPPSSGPQGRTQKYEIQAVAYTKKEAAGLHREFLKTCGIIAGRSAIDIKNMNTRQLLSRARIDFLRPSAYSPYNGLIYCCSSDTDLYPAAKIKPLSLVKIKHVFAPYRGICATLSTNQNFELSECTLSDLLCHQKVIKNVSAELLEPLKRGSEKKTVKGLYVLEIPAPYVYYDYPSEDKIAAYKIPCLRKLSGVEISELLFSYTGIAISNEISPLEYLFAGLDQGIETLFAWVKENSGGIRHFLMRLQDARNIENDCQKPKSTYCRWPTCLCPSASKTMVNPAPALPNFGSLMVMPIGFNKYVITVPMGTLEAFTSTLPLYKSKGISKELEAANRKGHLEHYCVMHRAITILLAVESKINLYSLEKCREFEDMLNKEERKPAAASDFIGKIQNGVLKDSLNRLYKAVARITSKRGNKTTTPSQLQKSMWLNKLRSENILFEHVENGKMPRDKLHQSMKSSIVKEIEQYKGWRLNEISMTADLNKLMLYYVSKGVLQANIAELRDIVLNPSLKKRYEQFNSLFKRLEESTASQKTEQFTRITSAAASNNANVGLKWGDMITKPCIPQRLGKFKGEPKFVETIMNQEKRMKQVIDTYNQAIRVKWRPEGSRPRPLTADPKTKPKRKNSSNSKLTISRTSERDNNNSILSEDNGTELRSYDSNRKRSSKNTSLLTPQRATTTTNARNNVGSSPKIALYQQHTRTSALMHTKIVYQSFKSPLPLHNPSPHIKLTSTIPHHNKQKRSMSSKLGKIYAGNDHYDIKLY